MNRYDTQVCLVSEQTTPNLTPLLDPERAPRRVVLVVSPAMSAQASWMESVIRRKGMSVERLPVADAYDYYGIEECLVAWLAEQAPGSVALNITGGTKLMAMAAQSAFQAAEAPLFYVNLDRDEVLPLGDRAGAYVLPQKIRLREYLEIHGYTGTPAKPEIPAAWRDLTRELVLGVKDFGSALGQLNFLAREARHNLRSTRMTERQMQDRMLVELLTRFGDIQLLRREDDVISFPGELARQFVNGGWLEFHVYGILADLAPSLGLADYAVGLKVLAPDGKTQNEMDASFLQQNRLHLIECKSANLAAPSDRGDSKATDALYKLETLRKIGGKSTRAMLIDYRGGLSKEDQARARDAGIRLVSADSLLRLKDEIRNWVHAPV